MFYNPLDPSKDGMNPIIDGLRYHIRNSESIKEQILEELENFNIDPDDKPIDVLEYILHYFGYDLEDLIIADQQRLLDAIYKVQFDTQKNLGYNIDRKF